MKIIVSGSIAYDYILDYPGFFADHINPDKIHVLSVSFAIEKIHRNLGGTAANIGYNLAMMGIAAELVGAIGREDKRLLKRFRELGIGIKYVKSSRNYGTAEGHIITDKADNQITGFYPGAMRERVLLPTLEACDWPIIAPGHAPNMFVLAKHYQKTRHRYIFDPGQELTSFKKQELGAAVRGASIVIGNDYEIDYLLKKLGRRNLNSVVCRTLGPKGSQVILPNGKVIKIAAAKAKQTADPTGAGDAYRAGLICGIVSGLDLKRSAQLGAAAAVFAVEKYGTQNHQYDYGILVRRHNRNFHDKI